MDSFSDHLVTEVTFAKSAQVGGTECLNNVVGYYMDQDPSPILYVAETTEKAEAWSKERFRNMILDTPCLRDKIEFGKGPISQNTIGFKEFSGGYIAIVGAGSDGGLSSRPIRIVIKDELDKWQITKAGDPDTRADMRTATFGGRKKIGNVSTPMIAETSRIMRKYNGSDKRKFHVPCPFCGHEQFLREGQLKFTRPGNTGDSVDSVHYECEACKAAISHMHKRRMLAKGRWIAEQPFQGHAGFWINALYSPWVTWKEYAEAFLRMKRQVDTYKTFVNEWRGEAWDEQMGSEKDLSVYLARCEPYEEIPLGGAILTAFVDVQADRLECEVKAWGIGRESWGIEHRIFYGEPQKMANGHLPEVWQRLDEFLQQSWPHESGAQIPLMCVLIDSGYLSDAVYKFCKPRRIRNIFPSKGSSVPTKELIGRASNKNREKVKMFMIGTNEAKNIIFSNIEVTEYGAGYLHFSKKYDADYFKQLLTSERLGKWHNGIRTWEKVSPSARNEAVDLNVGNLAAFELLRVNPEGRVLELAKQHEAKSGVRGQESGEQKEPIRNPQSAIRNKKGWISGWKK